MSVYYLDTSAWVKRYYQEPGSAWLAALLAGPVDVSCATLGLVELIATLARKTRAGESDAEAMQRAIDRIERSWPDFFRVHLISDVLSIATEAAMTWALRGADAVHLASAIFIRRKLEPYGASVAFVTSDQELRKAAAGERFETIDPEEAERSGRAP